MKRSIGVLSLSTSTAAASGARLRSSSPTLPRVANTGRVWRTVNTITTISTANSASERSAYDSADVLSRGPRRPPAPCSRRSGPRRRSAPVTSSGIVTRSASPSEVAEQPPEQQEDQHRAEASTTKLLGSVTRGESAKQLAHHHSLGRGPEMSAEDV